MGGKSFEVNVKTSSLFQTKTSDKCSSILAFVDDELQTNLVCGNETLKNNRQGKVLRITIDTKLNFVMDLLNINKNADIKFNALTK